MKAVEAAFAGRIAVRDLVRDRESYLLHEINMEGRHYTSKLASWALNSLIRFMSTRETIQKSTANCASWAKGAGFHYGSNCLMVAGWNISGPLPMPNGALSARWAMLRRLHRLDLLA
jgi:hypothetical protein